MEPFCQHEFGWRVALDFLLSGTGSSMYLAYRLMFLTDPIILLIGPFLVMLGLVVLFSELGKPTNFWRSIINYRTSWMARGAIFNSAFLLIWFMMLVAYALRFYVVLGLLGIIELPVAALVLIYPVMLLKDVRDITVWKSTSTAIVTLIYAIAGGLSADTMLVSLFQPEFLSRFLFASSVVELILFISLYLYINSLHRSKSKAVGASYRKMMSEKKMLSLVFAGALVPLAMDLASLAFVEFSLYLMIMGLAFSIAGVYAFRFLLLLAGYHEPLVSEKMIRKKPAL